MIEVEGCCCGDNDAVRCLDCMSGNHEVCWRNRNQRFIASETPVEVRLERLERAVRLLSESIELLANQDSTV